MVSKQEKQLIIENENLKNQNKDLLNKIEKTETKVKHSIYEYTFWDDISSSFKFQNFLLFVIICSIGIIGFIGFNTIANNQNNTINNIILQDDNLTDIFNKIEQNCNSVYITKIYGDENWYVFRALQKPNYIRFEDCLTLDTNKTSKENEK